MIPHGVVCLWEWDDAKIGWRLHESYEVDMDGHPKMRKDTEAHDWVGVVAGRAVTHWSMLSGVSLHIFDPPHHVLWVSDQFVKELTKLPNWHDLLADGHGLLFGTMNAAQRIMEKEKKK